MTIDAAQFRNLLGRFTTGVTIVTARDGEGVHHGMTVSAFCSLSLEPPLVLMCIDKTATMFEVLTTGESFTVNILASHQEEIARRFAAAESDKFEGIGYAPVETGAALEDVLANAQCVRLNSIDAGDHAIVVAEVRAATVSEGEPLLYFRGGYAGLGR